MSKEVQHHARTGTWPTLDFGEIPGANGETWGRVDYALRNGVRRMSGGSSLAKLIASRLGLDYRTGLRPLTKKDIVKWAKAHRRKTGRWPTQRSGGLRTRQGRRGRGWTGRCGTAGGGSRVGRRCIGGFAACDTSLAVTSRKVVRQGEVLVLEYSDCISIFIHRELESYGEHFVNQ